VYAPVLTLGAVVRQEVVGADVPGGAPRALVEVFSSVQWPFRFAAGGTTWAALPAGVSAGAGGVAEASRGGYVCDAASGECAQVWSAELNVAAGVCRLDGEYELALQLECRGASCPLDADTRAARFRFKLESSYFCPSVADEIALSASMTTFADGASEASKDDFLDGQVVFVELHVVSDKASLARAVLWEVVAEKRVGGVAVLALDLMDTGTPTTLGSAMALATTPGGGAAAGGASVVRFSFRVRTGAGFLALAQDAIEEVRVVATARVEYANAGQATVVAQAVGELAETGVAESVAEVLVRVRGGVGEGAGEGAGEESAVGGVGGAFAGAVAGACVALVVVAAAVVHQMRRRAVGVESWAGGTTAESSAAMVDERAVAPVHATGTTMSIGEIHVAYAATGEGEGEGEGDGVG
jgi:hypothetical protein